MQSLKCSLQITGSNVRKGKVVTTSMKKHQFYKPFKMLDEEN